MHHMQNRTTVYLAPSATVVEIKTEGLICQSPLMVMFLLDSAPATEINFDRENYGSATTDTWD